jgi:hypothetical protein
LSSISTVVSLPSSRGVALGFGLLILLPVGLTLIKRIRDWRYWNYVLAGTCSVLLLALIITLLQLRGQKPTSAAALAASSSTPAAHQSSSPPATPTAPAVRRHGVLVLDDKGTAYDLDAPPPGWNSSIGVPWSFQNISYYHHQGLGISDEPITDVVMGTGGNWTYQDCARAYYNQSYTDNSNNIGMSDLRTGLGICVHTENDPKNNPGKTDGGHYVLLVVQNVSSTALTLEVTVWQ